MFVFFIFVFRKICSYYAIYAHVTTIEMSVRVGNFFCFLEKRAFPKIDVNSKGSVMI